MVFKILHYWNQEAGGCDASAMGFHSQSMAKHCLQSRTFPESSKKLRAIEYSSNPSSRNLYLTNCDQNMFSCYCLVLLRCLQFGWSKIKESFYNKNWEGAKSLYTWRAWISNMTRLVGPPLEIGMSESILARVNAVAISPSSSILSKVPVGKKGNTTVNEETNMRGRA